jgi:hypothetical protein
MGAIVCLKFQSALDTPVAGIRRIIGLVQIRDLVDLISVATLDSNPRKPKRNDITDSICRELASNDHLYACKSRGLLVGSATVKEVSKLEFQLTLEDQSIEGILDGGHNTMAIGLSVLESATSKATEVKAIKDWDSFQKYWDNHREAISRWKNQKDSDLGSMEAGVEFILPVDGSNSAIDVFKRSIIDICTARNTSTPLKSSTLLQKLGLLQPIKQRLQDPVLSRIRWEQNGVGVVASDDLISLSLVAFRAFALENKLVDSSGKHIQLPKSGTLYSAKSSAINTYGRIMQSDTVTKRTTDYKRELTNAGIGSVFDRVAELPALFDHVYRLFPSAFNASSVVKFEDLQSISKYHNRNRSNSYAPYSGIPIERSFPDVLVAPVVRSLYLLLGFDKSTNIMFWKVDPLDFLTENIDRIVSPIPGAFIEIYSGNPNEYGKDSKNVVYEAVEAQVRALLVREA